MPLLPGASASLLPNKSSVDDHWVEASMDQAYVPLPPWAVRAGARDTIYHEPKQARPGFLRSTMSCGAP